ncbi:hypothetical protein AAHC03_012976 [Spirometra sp. Aus1]
MTGQFYPYINWLQKLTVYETPTHLYVAASDEAETRFRVLKIARIPVPFTDSLDPTEATLAAETPLDRLWRVDIFEDPHFYTRRELNLLLSTIQAVNRDTSVSGGSFLRKNASSVGVQSRALSPAAERDPPPDGSSPPPSGKTSSSSVSSTNSDAEVSNSTIPLPSELTMEAAAVAVPTDATSIASTRPLGTSSLVQSLTGFGLVGFVRFLFGYYLIVITQRREVARIGEHRIYKIEDTKMIYVPGEPSVPLKKLLERSSAERCRASLPPWAQDCGSGAKLSRLVAEETRFLKLFQSIDLSSNFYFSYSYDLTNSLQRNLEPFSEAPKPAGENAAAERGGLPPVLAFRLVPNDRFTWNFGLLPPRLRSPNQGSSDWFVRLVHGFLKQAVFASCGMPITVTLLARRSRHFAGTRFLKRGVNLSGDVANEVETEQIVTDLSNSTLARARASSFTQMRGSVPLFWSQETTKLVVGKPPLEINWEDPFYEAFGLHFANLIERFGAPVIVLNLMKQKEKRRFEQQLTEGYCRGIDYLNLFAPTLSSQPDKRQDEIPPIVYIGFDMARMQKSPNLLVLDRLRPIAEACVQRTGIFFSTGAASPSGSDLESPTDRARILVGSDLWPRQHGVIRVNCVDCLDRTNAGQYVIGHVVLAHQLRALGLLPETGLTFSSALSRLLQDLYEEHGDTLALQYGGSCLVHTIETYQRTGKLRSQSRDLMQTLSRYYSNNFSDFEKQLATDIFLRIYRPGAWTGSLATFEASRTALPPPLPPPDHDGLMATIAATTAASSSFPCDAAAEAHLHWLDSWARLPLDRPPLTGWWPLGWDVFSENGAHWKTWSDLRPESSAPATRYTFLGLLSSDPRTDWFTELYPPTQWTHFNTLTFCQLPVSTVKSERSPSPLCALQVAQLNQAYQPPRTSLKSPHSVGDFRRPSSSVPLTPQIAPSQAPPPPLRSSTPQPAAPVEPPSPAPKTTTTAAALARPPVVKGGGGKRAASKKGDPDDSLLLSDWTLGGAEDQNSSDSDESVLADNFIVASPPILLDRWRLARKPVTPDRGNKLTVAAESGSSLGPPTAVPEPPPHSLVNDTLQWFNNLRFSDLSTLSPKPEPAAAAGTTVKPSKLAVATDSSSPSTLAVEPPVVAVHYGQLQGGPEAPERTYNLCTSYSDFQLAPPSENDMALYQRYALVDPPGVMSEKSVFGIGQDVSPASLKTYTDAVKLSRTGVCSVPYESFLTYVHTVREKGRLGC